MIFDNTWANIAAFVDQYDVQNCLNDERFES